MEREAFCGWESGLNPEATIQKQLTPPGGDVKWSGRRDLNPRQPRWQRGALPLSYSRGICPPFYPAKHSVKDHRQMAQQLPEALESTLFDGSIPEMHGHSRDPVRRPKIGCEQILFCPFGKQVELEIAVDRGVHVALGGIVLRQSATCPPGRVGALRGGFSLNPMVSTSAQAFHANQHLD